MSMSIQFYYYSEMATFIAYTQSVHYTLIVCVSVCFFVCVSACNHVNCAFCHLCLIRIIRNPSCVFFFLLNSCFQLKLIKGIIHQILLDFNILLAASVVPFIWSVYIIFICFLICLHLWLLIKESILRRNVD